MSSHIATSDYEVIDRAPLSLEIGDVVALGSEDAEWPGWIWVTAANGRGSYVPLDNLDTREGDGNGRVIQAFQAADLSVQKGDAVDSLREVKGWHWCRHDSGREGWLPSYLLRPT